MASSTLDARAREIALRLKRIGDIIAEEDAQALATLFNPLAGPLRKKLGTYNQEKERLEMLTRTGGADAHNTIEKLKRVTDSIDILQKEIKKSEVLFSTAINAGCVSVTITNSLIQGQAGVGKTSTNCMLLDEPAPIVRTSTPLTNPAVRIQVVADLSSSGSPATHTESPRHVRNVLGSKIRLRSGKWTSISESQLQDTVVSAVAILSNQIPTDNSLLYVLKKLSTFRGWMSLFGVNALPITLSNSTNFYASSSVDSSMEPRAVIASVHEELTDRMAKFKLASPLPADNTPSKMLGDTWIYFTDTGGQPHFHNLLPHFVHGLSIAILVIRLSEKLDDCPMVEYYEDDELISDPYRSTLTTVETLKCLVRSMQSHTTDGKKPRLMIVGTFFDKIQESSETLQKKNEKLLKLLTPEFVEQLVFFNEAMDELIFPINAKLPGDHEKIVSDLIRLAIERSPSKAIDIPLFWYVLEICVKNISSQLQRNVLSKQECLEVAEQLQISEDGLIEAFKFFHEQHIFHYYVDILPNVVFTSTQVLLDKLTELVKHVYRMREAVSNPSTIVPNSYTPKTGKWQKFRDQGIITLEFLNEFNKHYVNELFTPSDLLKLFVEHLILTPFSSEMQVASDFTSQSAEYFMPSLLDVLPVDQIEECRIQSSSSIADPLLIRFPKGWPRTGVFCCLQVFLIQKLGWTLVCNRGKPKLIAQNCVMLSPPESICVVTLIDSFSYFEVHVNANPWVCFQMCPVVRDQILLGIDSSCRTLRYSKEKPDLAFFCPCGCTSAPSPDDASTTSEHHPGVLLQKEAFIKCTVDESKSTEVSSKHTIWLGNSELPIDVRTQQSSQLPSVEEFISKFGIVGYEIDQECSDDQILDIYHDLEKWEQVACHLGLKATDIEEIEYKAMREVELMRLHTLKKWKRKDPSNATYRVLLTALLKCGCANSAEQLCKLINPGYMYRF
ncbi:uncharacterized protein LOC135330979 isoform X2 [Halichondria panicea]